MFQTMCPNTVVRSVSLTGYCLASTLMTGGGVSNKALLRVKSDTLSVADMMTTRSG